jgi:fumarate hydratase class II
MEVPADALYGASTQRAVLNFPISGYRFERQFIRALGMVKCAAAEANVELQLLDSKLADLIVSRRLRSHGGKTRSAFPGRYFSDRSGTSTNMNANEVIANRCAQLANQPIGSREPVDPNNHVNLGQSSNDVIPTAIHVAVAEHLRKNLLPALDQLHGAFERKALEFWGVIKIGRTHLMDATPVRLGQEFSGYARQCELAVQRARQAIHEVEDWPLGGTGRRHWI